MNIKGNSFYWNSKVSMLTLSAVSTLTPFSVSAHTQAKKSEARPNIILIMVDDLGFSDIAPYGGSDIHTPHLTRLAQEGIRFRQFYNNSISAPTRASLITGQYQHNAGMGFFNVDLGDPNYQGYLNRESLTFGEVLHEAGYTTLISGKWHVGDKDQSQWPSQRGFDRSFGFLGGASRYYDAGENANARFAVELYKDNKPYKLKPGEYLTDKITDNALEFISEASKKKNPFFLYLAFNAPHWPLQALPEDIQKYKGVYHDGWDSLRVKRYENAKAQGVIAPSTQLTSHDGKVRAWNTLQDSEKADYEKRQEVYAAMVDRVDQEIGRVLDKLQEIKQDKNTLIIFISDNGAQGGSDARAWQEKQSGEVGAPGSWYMQNSNWSQTGNSPFRDYKAAPYEGGISAPFIAWYPGHIQANTIVDGVAHLIDIAPTFYDLAKAKYPAEYQGHQIQQLSGKSLLPVLYGKTDTVQRGEPLFWEWAGNRAVRDGKWKYIHVEDQIGDELYDIENDRAENHNVATEHPEVLRRLKQEWLYWAKQNHVKYPYPSGWPHFRW
ncbi:arylsulfatase [Segatella bryantii]|uniref:arylsulfatase n=1 Tax=Segatella bryantii TaxID=77095 RepID=UPI001EDC2568|nr:arylsulfatase [Segatella bryantii]MDR4931255.1 arylsulfatase [Segatella bryantii]UKK74931.1 arylsulfatase [Segatella bryantii]